MAKVYVLSLGCDKNRVDTENALYNLTMAGYEITADPSDADVAVINTCAFIKAAEKESIDSIFALNSFRSGKLKKLIVTGCLTERYKEELVALLLEADVFFGCSDYSKITDGITSDRKYYNDRTDVPTVNRTVSTPPHYAYLKISDGCDNHCTYCTIPSIRGKFRSRTIESLTEEAVNLEEIGAKEIIVVAQDVTKYGIDLCGRYALTDLLKSLINATDSVRFRLMYCYPELVTDELISFVSENKRMYPYMDIPLQHVSDPVLKRMGRKSTEEEISALFEKLNAAGITVRTTFMVGFPGETDEDVERLVSFIEKYKPLRAGVFSYSREEGTPAFRMKDQIPAKVKKERNNLVTRAIQKNILEYNKGLIGKTLDVVYDGIDFKKQKFCGRTDADAPDVDLKVYFTADFAEVGNTYKVKITGSDRLDLKGAEDEPSK